MTTDHPNAIPASLFALLLLSGCSSHELIEQSAKPGMFRTYSCGELNTRGGELVLRERELKGLMQKAEQGPGGQLAVALAYTNEYNMTLGQLRELEVTAADRKCALKFRSASDQVVR